MSAVVLYQAGTGINWKSSKAKGWQRAYFVFKPVHKMTH